MSAALRLSDEPRPLGELNTTPLIDVMLVLLVMFIVTIPLQSHVVKIDLPTRTLTPAPDPVRNKIVITATGTILWNGTPVTREALGPTLARTASIHPQPELHLQPEPAARYVLVDEVLAMTKRAGIQKMGFVGNEHYHDF